MWLGSLERAGGEICGASEQGGQILLRGRSLFAHFAFYLATRSLHGLQLSWSGSGEQIFGAKEAGVG